MRPAQTLLFFLRQFLELGQTLQGSRSHHRRTCFGTPFDLVRPFDPEITFLYISVQSSGPAYFEQIFFFGAKP